MVTAARVLGPTEIADLSVARLVHDHQWLAVAAYAKAGPDQLASTLAQLAGACDGSEAFAWFWGLVTRPDTPSADAGWSAFASLPASVGVPAELADGVVAFVSAPMAPANSRDAAAGLLLERLPGTLAKRASRAVLDALQDPERHPADQAVDQAIAILSKQRVNADRDRVLSSVQLRPISERLPLILSMSAPLRAEEIAALQGALEEALAQLNPALVPQMQSAWHLLTIEGKRSLLVNQIATSSDRCRAFLTPGLLEPLGVDQTLDFLAPDQAPLAPSVPPNIAVAIVEDLASTGEPFALELLDRAHNRLDATALRATSPRIVQTAQRWEPARRAAGLAALMRPAIRNTDTSIGEALLQGVLPEDFPSVVGAVRPRRLEEARFLGAWLAHYLGEGPTRAGLTSTQSEVERSTSVANLDISSGA